MKVGRGVAVEHVNAAGADVADRERSARHRRWRVSRFSRGSIGRDRSQAPFGVAAVFLQVQRGPIASVATRCSASQFATLDQVVREGYASCRRLQA